MTDYSAEFLNHLSPWSESIIDVLGVHLHRYLMPLLMDHKISHLGVMIGFEASHMPSMTMRVSAYGSDVDKIGVLYEDLVMEARKHTDIATPIQLEDDGKMLTFYPVLSISEPGREHIHAFVFSENAKIFDVDIFTVALRTRINEAIRSFRHNSLRIMFDESEGLTPKEFLDRVLDLVPVWCGADHSACLILSSSLESMVMSGVGPAHFQIVNEKIYCTPRDGSGSFDNLSSLEFVVNRLESSGLIGHAFDEVRRTKSVGLNIFIGDSETGDWFSMGEIQKSAHRIATHAHRPDEKLTVLLPLLCANEVGESELLGFLSINFFEMMPLASLTSRVLETLATRLGTWLRRSSFFSLSAQQLWLLECVREEQLAAERLCGKVNADMPVNDVLNHFISKVNRLIADSTHIPCFGIGYRTTNDDGEEILRFPELQGFSRFSNIDLPIYANEFQDSSLSALAVRLNRAITLTGGDNKNQNKTFNNEIYVNERLGILCDARMEPNLNEDWHRLSDYYKMGREGTSYAAICYPIRMKDEVVGVIAVEVDRDTNWVWWTGFGSYLFYRLLANELAADFSLIGLDVDA